MILRPSAKLAQKIHVQPEKVLPVNDNPFADWSAHLFTADRTQYVLVVNSVSLYGLVLYGKGITSDHHLINGITAQLRKHLEDDGLASLYERHIVPTAHCITIAKPLNRAVIGSMIDFITCAKILLTEHEVAPYDLAARLNDTPMSYLEYDSPRRAIRQLAPI